MTRRAVLMNAVTKRFGSKDVLRRLSLEVPCGGTLGIVGPSGCGKTTALRLMAGLELPDAGEIWLADRLASSPGRLHVSPSQRNIGFVFQDLALWPHMTVAGHLLFVLQSRRWPSDTRTQRIEEMLHMVGLGDRAGEYPSHLSGGEQQRVALARAFVVRPKLLLADEPTGSLDADSGAEVIQLLFEMNREYGTTLVLVTHDESLAARCGRVVRLAGGRIVA